jgi:hypothetical protein
VGAYGKRSIFMICTGGMRFPPKPGSGYFPVCPKRVTLFRGGGDLAGKVSDSATAWPDLCQGGMTTNNAFAFIALGFAMWVMPALGPGFFPRNGLDGSSTSALWLRCMASVQMGVGGWVLYWGLLLPFWQAAREWRAALDLDPLVAWDLESA